MRTFRGEKNQRPGGGARHQGSVQGSDGWRSTPDAIALARIGGRDAPHVLVDPGKLLPLHQAPELMRPGGGNGIGEVICVAVPLIAVVNPSLGVLMDEQGRRAADVVDSSIGDDWPLHR